MVKSSLTQNDFMLKVEVETLSAVKRRLRIEVPQEQVSAEIEKAYSGLGRQVRLPGFRPGRVPLAVLKQRFGDRVRGEVFGRLIQESLLEAVRQEQIEVAGPPEVVTERAEPEEALRFVATVEVYPHVDVQGYEGIELEEPVVRIGDADIDRYLINLQESLAQVRPVEGRTVVQRGDVATIDYEGRIEEQMVTRAERRQCEVGRGSFPEAFEARLIGAELGETIEFPVTYPADSPNPEVAGKTVHFRVTVHALAEKELPVLDDEFAKDHGECGTLAELRERVRERLAAYAAQQVSEQVRATAVKKLVAANDVEVPDSLVSRQVEDMVAEVTAGWRARKIWPKDEEQALAALRQEAEPRAREQVKAAVVLDAMAARERIDVSEEDLAQEIEQVAAGAKDGGDRVRAFYAQPEARQGFRARLRRQRALDCVLQRARITRVESAPTGVAGVGESR